MSRLATLVPALLLATACSLAHPSAVPPPLLHDVEVDPGEEPGEARAREEAAEREAHGAAEAAEAEEAALAVLSGSDDGFLEDDDVSGEPSDEGESRDVEAPPGTPEIRYSADLPDEELRRIWKEDPAALGSIAIGFTDEGRLVNGIRFPDGDGWTVVDPRNAFGTTETIDSVIAAVREVKARFPDAPPLRVNQLSAPEGGWLRPHRSHQNGRDVDLAFYYPTADPVRVRAREKHIDVEKTWALVKAIVTRTDVQVVLVDWRVQKVLYAFALRSGEDQGWLDSLFRGPAPLVQHARRHRDHLHVRFFNPRAQELGRRVAPHLELRPEQNVRMHRVRRGDTLSGIALRYGSTVARLRKANRIRGNLLRVSQVLQVPLQGPCDRCPVPPPVVVPERRLPPPSAEEPARSASLEERAPAPPAPQSEGIQ